MILPRVCISDKDESKNESRNENGQLLLWGSELVNQERQEREIAQQRAERLAAQLRAADIEPES